MKLATTSDTGTADRVWEISRELKPVAARVADGYPDVDLEIFTAFRCLPDEYNRRTFRRYDKRENVLYLDMCLSADRYRTLSTEEQRRDLSHAFARYLDESLRKYEFPGLDVDAFMRDIRTWLRDIGWLKEDWEIYICVEGPGDGPQDGECACTRCVLTDR